MGLSIHYTLRPPPNLAPRAVLDLVAEARRRSARLLARRGGSDLTALQPAEPDHPLLAQFASVRRGRDLVITRVEPRAGWWFAAHPGAECEPVLLGLADYPAWSLQQGRRRRTPRPGWGFHGACKTQYASLLGWAHFRRCHLLALDLLAIWRRLGVAVDLIDEGEFWPERDETALHANVDRLNRVVAGLAGALKDAMPPGASPLRAPIFDHPRFEHLEAEGLASDGPAIRHTVAALGLNHPGDA